MKMSTLGVASVLVSMVYVADSGAAVILTFDGAGGNNAAVPANYGDNVASISQDGFTYGTDGNGFTPNVVSTFAADWLIWNSAYGATPPVIWPSGNANPAMTLTADAGYSVTLESITLALENGGNTSAEVTVVVDGNQVYQQTFTSAFVFGQGGSYVIPLNFTGQQIVVTPGSGNNGSLGFDDVTFSQSQIPEPASLALIAGLGSLAFGRRRRCVA